ncbi:hypothetical protein [Parasitella parasitica]|uniref:Tc1-like transposase DDE domain-containing protein n=1 Tax=Parasitella parasitica TaxID=35722 RepID=A0A0B7NEQ2_9FUNG|nr:hypothetical protein [Parasitella parasitica]
MDALFSFYEFETARIKWLIAKKYRGSFRATIRNCEFYLAAKPKDDDKDTEMVDIPMIKVKVAKAPVNITYIIYYDDHTSEKFIDRMIEGPVRRGRVAEVARQFGIAYNTVNRWWKLYNETGETPYKKSEKNVGRPSSFSVGHEQHIEEIVQQNPQICADDIIDSLVHKFEGFSISKSQMNHHLKNNMFITKLSKPLASKKERSKKRKIATGKDQKEGNIVIEEPVVEYVEAGNQQDDRESNKAPSKGTTTAHFIKFMNELLDIMDSDENFKGSYFVMDNCTIHKSHPMKRKIEGRGYKVMYLPPYSPELNAIENFWAVVKGKMKRENLMTEETLSNNC